MPVGKTLEPLQGVKGAIGKSGHFGGRIELGASQATKSQASAINERTGTKKDDTRV